MLGGLNPHAVFFSAALPKRIFPPLFNRYGGASNSFGNHVDNAVRSVPGGQGERVRTDVSCTLFLAEPSEYDGGELTVEDTFGAQRIELPAGDMLLYPGTSLHRVEPVTRGFRLASFFWLESMVRSIEARRLLFDIDSPTDAPARVAFAITAALAQHAEKCEPIPKKEWKPQAELERKLVNQGWTVSRVKITNGCYEVYGENEKGGNVEVLFHPKTFELLTAPK